MSFVQGCDFSVFGELDNSCIFLKYGALYVGWFCDDLEPCGLHFIDYGNGCLQCVGQSYVFRFGGAGRYFRL